jgi:hypothetical protein
MRKPSSSVGELDLRTDCSTSAVPQTSDHAAPAAVARTAPPGEIDGGEIRHYARPGRPRHGF